MNNSTLELLADHALALDQPVRGGGLWALPDTTIEELTAAGHGPLPPTWSVERDDGRTVWFYSDGTTR